MLELLRILMTSPPAHVKVCAWEDGLLSVTVGEAATTDHSCTVDVTKGCGGPIDVLRDLHTWVLSTPQPAVLPPSTARAAQQLIAHCNDPQAVSDRLVRVTAIRNIREYLRREDEVFSTTPA